MPGKGIIFDLDGTLWDTSVRVTDAWNRALARRGGGNSNLSVGDVRGIMGKTADEIAALLFNNVPAAQRTDMLTLCFEEEVRVLKKHGGVLYPRLEETLRRLSGQYRLSIVSNCQPEYLAAFFDYHRLGPYFRDFECAGCTGLSKGENIARVVRRSRLGRALYVGDTQGDWDAAALAGVPFIHAAYGFGAVAGGAVRAINAIAELPGAAAETLA